MSPGSPFAFFFEPAFFTPAALILILIISWIVALRYQVSKSTLELQKELDDKEKIEGELRVALEKLDTLDRIISQSPVIAFLWEASPGWPVIFVSENVNHLGFDAREFLEGTRVFADIIHPDDLSRVEEEVARYSAERKTGFSQTYRIITPASGTIWVGDRTSVEYHDDGRPVRYQGILMDVTERKQREAEISRLNAELESRVAMRTAELSRANAELESFSYSVSHDLRAPLRALDGFSALLLRSLGNGVSPEAADYIEKIRTNTRKMARLIDDLLDFSRAGRKNPVRHRVEVSGIVSSVIDDLRMDMIGRDVRFITGALPPCSADPVMLEQVFRNLIGNAVKFTREKEVAEITIRARTKPGTGQVQYLVEDNGIGFDMRYVGKVFGVFERLTSSDVYEGNGVGLAIVKRIIERHGGSVCAKGVVGAGATFGFTLGPGGDGDPPVA